MPLSSGDPTGLLVSGYVPDCNILETKSNIFSENFSFFAEAAES
jgi:hypothetical protein